VLAVGADHLRAVDLSFAMEKGLVRDFTAIDDRRTVLDRIEEAHAGAGVRTRWGSPYALALGEARLADYGLTSPHLILCPSIFSRLSQSTGRSLASVLWDALRPGGQLFIGCMLDENTDLAFWECYAGWEPHLHTRRQVVELIDQIPTGDIAGLTLDTDPDNVLALLVLRKEG
jgi:hypothetical protein